MNKTIVMTCALCAAMVFPVAVQARIEFTEVMYDPAGTDAGREWIEIHNTASETVDVSGLKLFEEGVNHGLKAVVGTTTLAGGQYAVIADDSAKFMVDWPAYSGTLYDSSFSLKNTGEVLVLRGKDVDEDVLTFDPMIGAAGDGNTLQKQLSVEGIVSWVAVAPTPGGAPRATAPSVPASSIQSYGTSEGSVPATSTPVSVPQSEPENISPTITAPAPSQPQGGLKYIPVDPQIFCKINGKAELFAGVEATFSAQSWGLKKQPLQNARYVWNFGDGQTKEGQYVLHTYTQPGTYELFLATASDVYSATDRLRVLVRSPQLSLSHSEEVMIIENLDAASMDLFGLKVSQSGRPDFVFPEYSMVSGRAEMTIDVVQFSQTYAEPVRAFEAPITLQYLNGRVVATSTAREAKAVVVSAQKVATKAAPSTIKKAPTKSTKTVAKPKVANMAAQTIDLTASSSEGQIITLDTTAKERRLNYYGATIGVLALLAFAWWYLLR